MFVIKTLEWWYTSVIPTFRRQRQKDCFGFEASLGY